MRQDGVNGLPTEPLAPLRAVRVIPQRADEAEVLAAIFRAEQRTGLRAGPDDVRLGGRRCDLPDPLERLLGVRRERDRRLVRLDPALAEVVTVEDGRAPVLAGRRDEHPRLGAPRVD